LNAFKKVELMDYAFVLWIDLGWAIDINEHVTSGTIWNPSQEHAECSQALEPDHLRTKLAKERLLMALVMTMKKGRYPAYQFFSSRPFSVIDKADSEIVVGPVDAVALIKYAGSLDEFAAR
jgi:hypothetical protein